MQSGHCISPTSVRRSRTPVTRVRLGGAGEAQWCRCITRRIGGPRGAKATDTEERFIEIIVRLTGLLTAAAACWKVPCVGCAPGSQRDVWGQVATGTLGPPFHA